MPLVHHELCFGCGRNNLFGVLVEVQPTGEGAVAGRWFVKQDHQGPTPGQAHPGILACALLEALMLAAGEGSQLGRLQFELESDALPEVGLFCDVEAATTPGGEPAQGQARAFVQGRPIARMTCSFVKTSTGKVTT